MKKLLALLLLLSASASAQSLHFRTRGIELWKQWPSSVGLCGSGVGGCFYQGTDGHPHWYDGSADSDMLSPPSITTAATLGTLVLGSSTGATDGTFGAFTSSDALATRWNESFADAAGGCSGGGTLNHIHRMGWNIAPGGGRSVTGTDKSAFSDTLEQAYVGDVAACQTERYFEFWDTFGVTARPLFLAIDTSDASNSFMEMRAKSLRLGTGVDTSGPIAVAIGTTETDVYSPDSFKRLRLDNTQLHLEAGTTNSPAATLTLHQDGDFNLQSARGFVGFTGTTQLEWNSGAVWMQDSGGGTVVFVSSGDIQIAAGSGMQLRILPGINQVYVPVAPQTDLTQTTIGMASRRFIAGYFAAAAADQPSCDEPHEGGTMVVRHGAGVASTFEVCQMNADNSYSWHAK